MRLARFWIIMLGTLASLALGGAAHAESVPPTPIYFPILPFDAAPDAMPQMVPVAMNRVIDTIQLYTHRAIIVIHDESRDPNSALAAISTLAGAANQNAIILAPQYLIPSDLVLIAKQLPLPTRSFAVWSPGGWPSGEESAPLPGGKGISSFTVIDTLLMYLSNRYLFPKLDTVTVVGWGASANFLQRYAALGVAPTALADMDIDVRFLIAGASSYLYPTGIRPLGSNKGFGRPDASACPDYNAYPYGLDKLNKYGRRVGANSVKVTFPTRFVTYLVSPQGETSADTGCAARMQGTTSFERLRNFKTYLNSLYDPIVMQRHIFWSSDDMKSDPLGMLGSPCGMATLFGDGICPTSFANSMAAPVEAQQPAPQQQPQAPASTATGAPAP